MDPYSWWIIWGSECMQHPPELLQSTGHRQRGAKDPLLAVGTPLWHRTVERSLHPAWCTQQVQSDFFLHSITGRKGACFQLWAAVEIKCSFGKEVAWLCAEQLRVMDGPWRKGVATHKVPESRQQMVSSFMRVFSTLAASAHIIPEVEISQAGLTYKASMYHRDLNFFPSVALKGRS